MSAVIATIRRVIRRDRPKVVYECRHCGMTVDAGTDECPACPSSSIARYEIR